MNEIYLIRHGKSPANDRDPAFSNIGSPLDRVGEQQVDELSCEFEETLGVKPSQYVGSVAVSEYMRARQTADRVGFQNADIVPLINEATIPPELLAKGLIVAKHQKERWAPDEVRERAALFLDAVSLGELAYEYYFTHGLFIAAVKLQLSERYKQRGDTFPYTFDDKRGYVPDLATITKLTVQE